MPGSTIPPFAHVYDALEFDPMPTPIPSPTPPMNGNATPGDVMPAVRQLATDEHAIAAAHGFAVGPSVDTGLVYQAGSALLDIGHEALRQAEEEYNKLPTL